MPDNSNNNTYVTQPIYDEVEYLLESDQLETSNGHAEISLDDINDVGSSNEPIRQRCSNLGLFITTVAAFALVMNCLEMYILSIITTLEKQFGLTSFYSGMLISCKELSFALFGAVFSHIAIYTHRPRFLSVMGFIAVFGGILSALPHFVFIVAEGIDVVLLNSSSTADTSDIFCITNSTDQNDQLDQLATFNRSAYAFLVMSAFIIGFSNCTLTPVAVTYIDDGASPKNNGLYLGIIQCMKPLGPLIAFLGGGFFMKFYTTLNDPGFTSSSPQWIGAWWLGYLVYPAVIFIVALLLLPFPRTPEHEDPQHQYPHRNKEKEYESKAILTVIKAFFLCIYRLCTNHIYMLLLLSSCLNAYLVAGFFPFLPKYIEIQFHQTASVANTITGVMVTFLAGVGILFGGFLVSRLQMKTSQCALVVLFSDVVFIIGILLNMLVKCDQTQYLTHSNSTNHSYVALSNTSCLTPCHCADVYSPVCGSDSLTYLSPCHAGCSGDGNETSTYSSCSCGLSSASAGICSSCHALPIYMTLISVAALLGFIAIIPSIVITLRCVQLEDRTVALAFSSSVTNLVSFVPGPMLFGAIIDSTCLRWQKTITSNTPDDHGACMLYDVDAFRVKVHSLTVAFKIAATIIVVVLYVAIVRWQKKNGTDRTDRYTDMQDVTLFDITQTDRGVDVGMSSAGGDTGASRTKENSDSN